MPRPRNVKEVLGFVPHAGAVLICDFGEPGSNTYAPPEMNKARRVIVLTPRVEVPPFSLLVVPVSTTPSKKPSLAEHRIPAGRYRFFSQTEDVWAKTQMLSHVAAERLSTVREIPRAQLGVADLYEVHKALLHAVGLARLESYL